jgi:hypothetical protein
MFHPRFNSLCLVFSFIGCDGEQYDRMPLYLMLMKCYYHLHSSLNLIIMVLWPKSGWWQQFGYINCWKHIQNKFFWSKK